MKLSLRKTLGITVASAVVLLGSAIPAQAANAEWQAQKEAFRTSVTQYKAAKTERRTQLRAIQDTFKAAIAAAKAGPEESRKAAVDAARAARQSAVAALGAAPVKPVRPAKPERPAGGATAPAPSVGGVVTNP